ncbi:deoxyadenosine kinase [Pediococcus claussenii]|uniref:deoxynucleoside kinase n=1 Tax=Pediococcus claussenii TaxID=187452 RepID=UPI00081AA1C2|nr:deoxynucleoside kinase [Pediococcus claussenii]ANZ69073.1 deoxyadenosine kinase [Pediococcus claussenii]
MIALSGPIGAGKTTLTELLTKHWDSQAYYESVDDNKILPLFYKDPKRYAFLLQIYFLNKRMDSIKAASGLSRSVMDRSIYEDSLLFHLNADMGRATDTEVSIYDSLLSNMMEELPRLSYQKNPDLLLHIDISFDTMLKRIKKRGRSYEQIDADPELYDYYKTLNQRYVKWFDKYDQSPKIKINGDQLDFVESVDARAKVLDLIDAKVAEM